MTPHRRLASDGFGPGPSLPLFNWAVHNHCEPHAPSPRNPCSVPADPPPETALIRDVLRTCIGRHAALTAPQIADKASLWPDIPPASRGTRVRQLVRTWYEVFAMPGYVLMALSDGFWYSDDPEEFAQFDRTTQSRIRQTALTLRRSRLQARVSAGFTHHGRGRWTRADQS